MTDTRGRDDDIFERAKLYISKGFIESRFGVSGARWSGDNYETVSPLRDDIHPGSFSIRSDGVWYDRATGETGDIISLVSKADGVSLVDAAYSILGESPPTLAPVEQAEEKKSPPIRLSWMPIPDGKVPKFNSKPDLLTLYYIDDTPAFYVVRYNATESSKKIIYPVYWTGGAFEKGLPDEIKKRRPLLPFDRDKTVVIVEGEKNVSDASKMFPEYSWTSWHGGAPAIKYVDLSPLAGCNVILWPDLDEPGEMAADYLCSRLADIAGVIMRVVPPLGKDKGWDVSDAIAEEYDVQGLLDESVIIDDSGIRVDPTTIVEPHEAAERPYTDVGNAERFIDMWGHVLRYNVDKNKWLVWNKGRWNDSDQTVVTPMAKRTIRNIALTENKRDSLFWARKSESARAFSSMMFLAKAEPGIPVTENDLDKDMYFMNCPNGIVDLRTGVLMEAKPEYLCYKITNTDYNMGADCPLFMRFLEETFCEDDGIINFIQRWLGYSLTSDVSAQTFAVFHGIGANGKSTLVETIQRVAGDYVRTAPPETFIQKMSGGIPNDIAALRGARMVLTTETEANARLAEAKVKSMTGGDRVSARYMRGEFFEITPTWKITISTNHRPRISGGDYGIWRRVVLVPFNNVVTPDKQDPLLPNKLLKEAEGILNWCVKGAVSWYKSGGGRLGLQVPESVYAETQEYREDEDVIGRFLATGCLSHSEIASQLSRRILIKDGSPASMVFYSFRYWAEKEGEDGYAKMTQNMFGRAMRERGYILERTSKERYYAGVVPKPEFARNV